MLHTKSRESHWILIGVLLLFATDACGRADGPAQVALAAACTTDLRCPADSFCEQGKCEPASSRGASDNAGKEMGAEAGNCRNWGQSCLASDLLCAPDIYACREARVCKKDGESCRFNWPMRDCCGQCLGNSRTEATCRSCAAEGAACARIEPECRDAQACVAGRVCRKSGLLCVDDGQCCTGQCVGKFGDKWCSDCAGVGAPCEADASLCDDLRLDCQQARVCVRLGEECDTDGDCCMRGTLKRSCRKSAWHNHRTCHRAL